MGWLLSSILHCVVRCALLYAGTNDYNWLPPSALKPFVESHPGLWCGAIVVIGCDMPSVVW